MNAEPFATHELIAAARTVYQHKGEIENRKHDHVQKLWDKTAENPGHLVHI